MARSSARGLAAPDYLLRHLLSVRAVWLQGRAPHALEVFRSESKLAEDLFVGNPFAAGERGPGCLDLAGLFRTDRLIVVGGAG